MLASPFQAGLLDQRLRNLPPNRDLVLWPQLFLQQLLVERIDQGVILQSPSRGQASLFEQLDLLPRSLIENLLGIGQAIIRIADEIVNIDDPRFDGLRLRKRLGQARLAKSAQSHAAAEERK